LATTVPGKSTLIKTMSGAYVPDSGQILIDGQPVTIQSPQDSTRLGIETVYQDLALCDNLDVVANLWLGREAYRDLIPGVLRVLDETEMERQTIEVLRSLEVKIPSVRSAVASLSGGQRQCIAVAKTILRRPKVVLLDEPTAALGVAQTRQVLNLILRLKQQGLAVVVISHNLHDVFEVTDRITVMRLGARIASFTTRDTTPETVVGSITGASNAGAHDAV
jgi:D-xylose transport system ATP-binding protein